MTSEKDQIAVLEAKKLLEAQIEETKKLNLGLDADSSSEAKTARKSLFDGFTKDSDLSALDTK